MDAVPSRQISSNFVVKFSGTVRAFLNQNIIKTSVTLRSSMRLPRLILVFAALILIIVVTREPTRA